MKTSTILTLRLRHQQISHTTFTKPAEVVSHLIAMQAQEFAMAKWAIGLRLPGVTEKEVDEAFNKGEILRTHLMRPTWHFVAPGDIRWLLQLTAPRVHAINAFTYRQQQLDESLLARTTDIIAGNLEGNRFLTREALNESLERAGIQAGGIRLAAIMMYAELEGVICSGPREGKQFTYALLDERVPATPAISREEALAGFAYRYFATRGPASLQDFATWSGLSMKDAREGAATLPADFEREMHNGEAYYFLPAGQGKGKKLSSTFLMPDYDEYGMSYKDRSALFAVARDKQPKNVGSAYYHMLVVDGKIYGTWKRIKEGKLDGVEFSLFKHPNKKQEAALLAAEKRFREFYS